MGVLSKRSYRSSCCLNSSVVVTLYYSRTLHCISLLCPSGSFLIGKKCQDCVTSTCLNCHSSLFPSQTNIIDQNISSSQIPRTPSGPEPEDPSLRVWGSGAPQIAGKRASDRRTERTRIHRGSASPAQKSRGPACYLQNDRVSLSRGVRFIDHRLFYCRRNEYADIASCPDRRGWSSRWTTKYPRYSSNVNEAGTHSPTTTNGSEHDRVDLRRFAKGHPTIS